MQISVILAGYPVFSETFIAREILGLERAGLNISISALGYWPKGRQNTVHEAVQARVTYLSLAHPGQWVRLVRSWRELRHSDAWTSAGILFEEDLRLIGRFRTMLALSKAMLWWSIHKDNLPDVIYSHWISRPASMARYAACLSSRPWCCSAHARDIWTSKPETLQNRLNSANWVVTCNSHAYGVLSSLAGDRVRLYLSHHGVDLAQFPTAHRDKLGPEQVGTDNSIRILTIGRAVSKKGFDVLLRALASLPAEINWHLKHVGSGPGIWKLKWQAHRLAISNRITWMGALPSGEILQQLRNADMFVLASLVDRFGDQDGLPNVLVEACSQALPCVSTRMPSIEDLIEDSSCGLLVEPGDPSSLADAICKLARDPALRRRLGVAAERRVHAQFDCATSCETISRLLEKTVVEDRQRCRSQAN